jgi:flavin reductase (DIM6/NTAB) family NADH-FMN oxidoreductase RutF
MDPRTKQKALRLLTNGMYVLTSHGAHGPSAATVTWVSQASLKPPLVMAAIRNESTLFRCLVDSRVAVLHILDRHQKSVAQKFFSSSRKGISPLKGEPFFIGKSSAPILANLFAYIECKVLDILPNYGDHALVILEVVNAELIKDFRPLTVSDTPWQYGG